MVGARGRAGERDREQDQRSGDARTEHRTLLGMGSSRTIGDGAARLPRSRDANAPATVPRPRLVRGEARRIDCRNAHAAQPRRGPRSDRSPPRAAPRREPGRARPAGRPAQRGGAEPRDGRVRGSGRRHARAPGLRGRAHADRRSAGDLRRARGAFRSHALDLQPLRRPAPEPLDLWTSPPFQATRRDGKMFGRGISDDKGHIAARLLAIDALLEVRGELPCRIKFVIEGEEEVGSVHLPELVHRERDRLAGDACLWEFGASTTATCRSSTPGCAASATSSCRSRPRGSTRTPGSVARSSRTRPGVWSGRSRASRRQQRAHSHPGPARSGPAAERARPRADRAAARGGGRVSRALRRP